MTGGLPARAPVEQLKRRRRTSQYDRRCKSTVGLNGRRNPSLRPRINEAEATETFAAVAQRKVRRHSGGDN